MTERPSDDRYNALSEAIGYAFNDQALLDLALTHDSFSPENNDVESNERLEFLGDAVLGLVIAETLFIARPEQPEGDLAKARAEVVSATSLAQVARSLDLGSVLRLGKGEELSGGRDKVSVLADAMEAVIAAVYLDGGPEAAKALVNRCFAPATLDAQTAPGFHDYKSRLQERALQISLGAPSYETTASGPDHEPEFESKVTVGSVTAVGSGTSKKQAQQHAAQAALHILEEKYDGTRSESGQVPQAPATVPTGGTK